MTARDEQGLVALSRPQDVAARHRRLDIPDLLTHLLLSVGAVGFAVPFLWMITSAFKLPQEVVAFPPVWLPSQPTMANIVYIWQKLDFARYFANSLVLTVIPTAAQLLTSTLVGYVLAKYTFRGRDLLFFALIGTMMIPYPVTLIPSYQMMVWLHWIDTYWALLVPGMFSSFGIFLVRQFMHSIPDEILDAGRIDGASEYRIFVQLVLPLSGPLLSALGIFFFMWHWDSFLWPMLILNTQSKFNLTVALATFRSEFITDYASTMAGAAISVLPVLIVYLLLQRYFVAGVALTGIKG